MGRASRGVSWGARLLIPVFAIAGLELLAAIDHDAQANTSCWMTVEGQLVDPCQNPNAPVAMEPRRCPPAALKALEEARARGDQVVAFYCA